MIRLPLRVSPSDSEVGLSSVRVLERSIVNEGRHGVSAFGVWRR
jgi:hypothetical protein